MEDEDACRRRAEALLRAATETGDMKRRGELINEAVYWHNLGVTARGRPEPSPGNDEETGDPAVRG